MSFAVPIEKIRELFPSFIIIDRQGHIIDFGSAISQHVPSVRYGDPLENHFFSSSGIFLSDWDKLARERGRTLELHAVENGLVLTGAIIPDAERYLLALNPATASLALGNRLGGNSRSALQISDFTPGDPAVDVLLLVRMQQAMLEDAGTLATSLEKERQRNEGLVQRVSRLAGFLAHDFNNILSIIRLNAERLTALEYISTEGRRLASMIGETAERGSGITRSFMTISREHTEIPSPQPADDLIFQHAGFFSTISGPDVIVTTNLHASPAMISVSSGEFINCLTNLVINAKDAISNTGTIDISTSIVKNPRQKQLEIFQVTVTDTGSGMTEEILQKVFEPFFTTKKQGNGIGLPAVADYVRECGGDIRLESSPGLGTKVYLTFPIVMVDKTERASEISGNTNPARIDLPRVSDKAQTVLLVEDEPYALEALVEMLEAEGFEVWPAKDAEEATRILDAEAARSKMPTILLTDVILPRRGGIELAKTATTKAPQIRVILMSGFVPADSTIESDWLFAPKPLDPEKLLQMLKS